MADSIRIPVFAGNGENLVAELRDFQAYFFEGFLGEAAGYGTYAAFVSVKCIVNFAVDFEVLQVVLAEDGASHAGRRRNDGLRNNEASVVIFNEAVLDEVVDGALYLVRLEGGNHHAADFLRKRVLVFASAFGQKRKQVANDGVVPLAKKLQGGILEGVVLRCLLIVAPCGKQLFEQVFALVDVLFVAELHQVREVVLFGGIEPKCFGNVFGVLD